MAALTVDFRKTQWTNTRRWHGSPNHHWLWKLHTGLQATWILCLSTLPPDSVDLDFQMKCKNLLSSEKRTLDHWSNSPVLFLHSPGKMLLTLSLVQKWLGSLFLKTSERGDSWCTDSSFSPLLVKLSQVVESALLDSILKLAVNPCCLCTFSYPNSSFQSTLHLICFDTALCKQPHLSVMTFCDLPSLWRASMFVFWIIAKSAVFSIIVVFKEQEIPRIYTVWMVIYWNSNVNILIFEILIFDFHEL